MGMKISDIIENKDDFEVLEPGEPSAGPSQLSFLRLSDEEVVAYI